MIKKFYNEVYDILSDIKANSSLPVKILIIGFFIIVPFSVTSAAIFLMVKAFFNIKK